MEVIGAGMLVLGAFICLLASIGLLRFPDAFTRLQASAKVAAFASGLVLVGTALVLEHPALLGRFLVLVVFVLVTASVASHLLVRGAYVDSRTPLWERTQSDALRARLEPGCEAEGLREELGG
ncbi:MAG TPA: monovalent cation/H(+) antiporter subunit G [Polyangiaceae bacterium]|nr:monovalent cation/H(+) antiporter subunit G [Polyangiaceae bacterium]